MSTLKILHIISQHPESTGSGFYLQNILKQSSRTGHENFLIAGISNDLVPDLAAIERKHCLFVNFGSPPLDFPIPGMSDVMPYPSSRFSSLFKEQLADYDRIFTENIEQAVSMFSPDIIHTHHLWLASSAARRACPQMPMVTSCHSTDLRQLSLCPHLAEQVIDSCSGIDRVLSLSHEQARRISSLHRIQNDRIDIIGGGLDTALFTFQQKAAPPPVEILYAGKLSYAKGVDLFLKAFAAINRTDVHLHLAGSGHGSEERHCLELATKLGNQVTVHGSITQQRLAKLMGRCHIFVLPSYYEGLPLVLLEAVAAGCRIVTTSLPGCLELLAEADDNMAAIVQLERMQTIDQPEPADIPVLASRLREKLTKMVEKVYLEPTPDEKITSRIIAPFDWQSVFQRIEKSYDKAIAAKRN